MTIERPVEGEQLPPTFVNPWGYDRATALLSVGEGWAKLINEFFDLLDTRFNSDGEKVYVTQVKEKFGGLRLYTGYGCKELFELTYRLETESLRTCESCGEPGEIMSDNGNPRGWLKTQCVKCGDAVGYKPIVREKNDDAG